MTEDENGRESQVFIEAIELPADERAAFLKRACASDDALRQRVMVLLADYERVGDFLERPLTTMPHRVEGATVGEKVGDRIGSYKLLQLLGEGGCGVVFMAEQESPVRRRVALKIIKPGMDTKSVVARFEAERQALALMDHPNIAKVFEAGATASGRPYFAMELVRGLKITEYCDQKALSTAERLGLFVQVCHAVQHAHQKGIIHRDLKPSNILVTELMDGAPAAVVIDFGIAKATMGQRLTEKTLFTAFEMLVGTPAYMSPEQAALTSEDVDTRSDIYSLGILLYELLTGAPPFDGSELLKKGLDEIRRVICQEEAVRPSTRLGKMKAGDLTTVAAQRGAEAPALIRTVRGDLDWIVMKALEKDRRRRYETANGLALDVQRFLAHETISARPPSALYRLEKTAQRNKLLFAGIGLICVLLVTSLAVVSMSLERERQAHAQSQRAFHLADAQKIEAQENTRFLEEMLKGVGPSVARGQDTKMLRGILDSTAKRLGAELTNQPEVEAHLSGLVGELYLALGNYPQAEQMERTALGINRALYGTNSAEAATSLNDLGLACWREKNNADAEKADLEALEIRRQLFGAESTNVATTMNNLADVYRHEHLSGKAEVAAREALRVREKAYGPDSLEAAESMRILCILAGDARNYGEGETLAREVLRIRRADLGSDDLQIAESLNDLAWVLGYDDRWDEVEQLRREALALQGNVLDHMHPKYLDTLESLCQALEHQGKWSEASEWRRKALELWTQRSGVHSDDAFRQIGGLVTELSHQGKEAEAEKMLHEMLPPQALKQPECLPLVSAWLDLLGEQARWDEARVAATAAADLEPGNQYRDHELLPLLALAGDRVSFRDVCQKMVSAFGKDTDLNVMDRVAQDCVLIADSGADLAWVKEHVDKVIQSAPNDPSLPFFQDCEAMVAFRQGQYDEAVNWANQAMRNVNQTAQAKALAIKAMALSRMGQTQGAEAALTQSESFAQPVLASKPTFDSDSWLTWLHVLVTVREAGALLHGKN